MRISHELIFQGSSFGTTFSITLIVVISFNWALFAGIEKCTCDQGHLNDNTFVQAEKRVDGAGFRSGFNDSLYDNFRYIDGETCGKVPLFSQPERAGNFRILHGEDARIGEWPFVVQILACDRISCIQCTGSILNRRWILTAAHCLEEDRTYTVQVSLYDLVPPNNRESYVVEVERVFAHPNYGKEYIGNDVGLIKLSKPLVYSDYVQPVCLIETDDTYSFTRGKTCYVIGYGQSQRQKDALWLQKLRIEHKRWFECTGNALFLVSNTICIGPRRHRIGSTCMGDSGGPNVCYDRRKAAWVIFGTVSYGPERCDRGILDPWTTASSDIGKFRNWIKRTMENN